LTVEVPIVEDEVFAEGVGEEFEGDAANVFAGEEEAGGVALDIAISCISSLACFSISFYRKIG